MLIKNHQLKAFANLNKQEFVERMMGLLRDEFESARQIPNDEFKVIIANQIKKAEKYAIQIESNIAKYIITAFLMGVDFDKDFAGARKILENIGYHENKKIESLEEWTLQIFENLESKN